MKYAKFVPKQVRGHIESWCFRLRCDQCGTAKQPVLIEHRKQCAFLRRLSSDDRMREAYSRLTNEFTEDWQWSIYIDASIRALMDFQFQRLALKRARALRNRVITQAETLARTLSELRVLRNGQDKQSACDINWPEGLIGLHELRYSKELLTDVILRRRAVCILAKLDLIKDEKDEDEFFSLVTAPDFRRRFETYIPKADDVVRAIGQAAAGWEPRLEDTAASAATSARSSWVKSEYVRALWHGLNSGKKQFCETADIIAAIAATTTVAMDDGSKRHQPVATDEDVRKTLDRGRRQASNGSEGS